jgi:Fic family protein
MLRYLQMLIQHRLLDVAQEIQKYLLLLPNMMLSDKFQQANRLKAWLDSFRPLPTTVVVELKKLYDVRFTYNSNAIEGNTLTQSETALVLETGIAIGGKTLREHLEVIGHKDAIDYIEELAQNATPIGEWEIKQIHNLILRAISPEEAGCYRQLDVTVVGTEYIYPPYHLLNALMVEFVTWLKSAETASQHPIQFAAEAHLRFISIYPFRDGNGRTGRLLMNLLLLRFGYPIAVISDRASQAYTDAIVEGQQQNISPFLELLLDAAQQSLIETLRILSTAQESQGRGFPFYEEMLAFLNEGN